MFTTTTPAENLGEGAVSAMLLRGG
jgi:hypothetical protein